MIRDDRIESFTSPCLPPWPDALFSVFQIAARSAWLGDLGSRIEHNIYIYIWTNIITYHDDIYYENKEFATENGAPNDQQRGHTGHLPQALGPAEKMRSLQPAHQSSDSLTSCHVLLDGSEGRTSGAWVCPTQRLYTMLSKSVQEKAWCGMMRHDVAWCAADAWKILPNDIMTATTNREDHWSTHKGSEQQVI